MIPIPGVSSRWASVNVLCDSPAVVPGLAASVIQTARTHGDGFISLWVWSAMALRRRTRASPRCGVPRAYSNRHYMNASWSDCVASEEGKGGVSVEEKRNGDETDQTSVQHRTLIDYQVGT